MRTSGGSAEPRLSDVGDLTGLRALIYVAILVNEYPRHLRAPGRILNAAVPYLAAIGRLLQCNPA